MTFVDKVISAINTHPHRKAFCIQDKMYTYSELAVYISAVQKQIADQCAGEERIGIAAADDIATYVCILAIMLSGKTYIPIGPGEPADRVEQIVEQSGMKTIFSREPFGPFSGVKNLIITDELLHSGNGTIQTTSFDLQSRNAYILFTSGSTGKPKGVPLTYHNLNSFVDAFFALGYKVSEQDRFLQMFDLTFDLSIMSYLIPLCLGACCYTASGKGSKYANVYTVLSEYGITFALMVPSILSYLRPYFSEVSLPELRYSLFCGEALHSAVAKEWMQCAPNAVIENVYGPTEATIFCTTYHISRTADVLDYNGVVSIGKPMQNVEAVIADEDGHILADNEKGELCLHGGQVTDGYLDAEKTKQAFFVTAGKRYYRTGDVVFKNEEGNFIYCGRADHQVKVQGFRVELGEIEFHLKAITGNPNAVALALHNPTTNTTQIDAVLEGTDIDVDTAIDELRAKLPAYMIPSQIHFVASFPLNKNGKIDRNELKKMIATIS
jgi:D-alanine--poly(phosphoribitol) ligase subunit 1